MSKIYSMIAPLLGVSLYRMLNEIGVNQTAGSMVNSAYQWLLTLNPIVVIILGVIVFFAGQASEMGRHHNDHRRHHLPRPAVPIARHLESKGG